MAIRFGCLPDSDLLHRPLGHAAWRLVASLDYLARAGHPAHPAALSAHAQVRFASPAHINDLRFKGLEAAVTPCAAVTATNGEAVRHLVLHGIARFSDVMIDANIAAGPVVEFSRTTSTPCHWRSTRFTSPVHQGCGGWRCS